MCIKHNRLSTVKGPVLILVVSSQSRLKEQHEESCFQYGDCQEIYCSPYGRHINPVRLEM